MRLPPPVRRLWHRYPTTTLFLAYISVAVTLLLLLRVTCR